MRIGAKIVEAFVDSHVFVWAARGDVGGAPPWIVLGKRLLAAE
jgi:hypothetical protein